MELTIHPHSCGWRRWLDQLWHHCGDFWV